MKNRRLWFTVHGWLSLPVWVLFCFICVTGTVAVISHELTWLTNPAARAANPDGLPARPLAEQVAAVQRAATDAEIGFVMRYEPYLVTAVSFSSPATPQAIAYVNPYSGKVQAINEGVTFIGFMRALHGWLLFPWQHGYSIGYYLVAAMSIVVLGALITGLVVYKRFWRAFTRPKLRFERGPRTWLGDLHRQAGVWSLWFMLVMGLTGLWYLSQGVMWHAGIDIEPATPPLAAGEVPLLDVPYAAPPDRISMAEALTSASRALPGVELAFVAPPEHNRDYYRVAGSGGELLFDQYSHRALVNPWRGTVDATRSPATMGLLETLTHIADPLHYGTFGGLWTKAIWFLFGLVLSGMSVTGFLIWSKRTFKELRAGRQPRRERRERRQEGERREVGSRQAAGTALQPALAEAASHDARGGGAALARHDRGGTHSLSHSEAMSHTTSKS